MRNRSISAIGIILLLIGVSVIPSISGNIKTINKSVYEDVTDDRIADMYGLKFDDRGYIINNPLDREDTNLVKTNYNGPGEINPIWITIENLGYLFSIKVYEGYIYAVGFKHYPEEDNDSALLAKFDITDGELLWIKTWEGFHPWTWAFDLEVYNDYIYVVGTTGPSGGIKHWCDSFLCKYDLDGNRLWSKLINETKFDYICGIKEHDNYLYLCGGKDAASWILKYDINGNKIWSETYEIQGTWLSEFLDLEIYNGYIYAEGQTDSFDDNTRQDVLVVKISLDGELIWYREWGGPGPDGGYKMDVSNDNIYVCGAGQDHYDIWGGHDILLNYDLDGNLQWDTTSFCSPGHTSDVIAYNGFIYSGGEFYRFEYEWDAVLYKFDEDSKLIWYLTYGPYSGPSGYANIICIEVYEDFLYICGDVGSDEFLMKYDVTLFSDNNKPDTPSKPSGPTSGKPGEKYTYATSATDPDGDLISYDFSWGDWNITTVEWYNPGEIWTASYSWSERGKYKVRVRARDECGFVSDWSDPLEVTMPRNRAINTPFLRFLQSHPNLFPILRHLLRL